MFNHNLVEKTPQIKYIVSDNFTDPMKKYIRAALCFLQNSLAFANPV